MQTFEYRVGQKYGARGTLPEARRMIPPTPNSFPGKLTRQEFISLSSDFEMTSAYQRQQSKACLGCAHIVHPASCIIMSESYWTTLELKKLRSVYHEVRIYYINVGGTKLNLIGQKVNLT